MGTERLEGDQRGRVDRRGFLRRVGIAGGGAVLWSLFPRVAVRAGGGRRKVYRLSTRGQAVCTACKGHAANRFFRHRPAADRGRAHAGCNCRIRTEWISAQQHQQYFGFPPGPPADVFDVRWQGE